MFKIMGLAWYLFGFYMLVQHNIEATIGCFIMGELNALKDRI